MSRIISRAEAWENIYTAYQQINFATFEYDTVKKSLVEYIKTYHPESFNDYIESSEFIAVLEMFAYISEIIAYRLDFNAHENFITSAQRKESVLRLAKLISYTPSRNIPGRGLVKLTSVKTTEKIYDAFGQNLANKKIIWNDVNNSNWKSQFIAVINRVLGQSFGSVLPSERAQIDDVLFEIYSLKNSNSGGSTPTSVFPFIVSVEGGTSLPMELVPVEFDNGAIVERRPESGSQFNLLYAQDGLGDSSNTTGFMSFVKQGTLVLNGPHVFDGQTPNQVKDILTANINDTDVWVNNVDPVTGKILTDSTGRIGEWVEVDLAHAQNIIFNTNTNRRKYEIESLADDKIRIIFGDGEFADIPSGTFQIWYRVSENADIVIPQTAINNQTAAFSYVDDGGKVQTFTFTFSLISSIQNNSASEDIDHIRRVAPSVYYTQDRMVNGRDYNTFMLQDPSILKLRAVNRTFSGDSKYISWHDPKEYYESVKIFGDDMVLYYDQSKTPVEGKRVAISTPLTANEIILNYLQPYLSSMDFFEVIAPQYEALGYSVGTLRSTFLNKTLAYDTAKTELGELSLALNDPDQLVIALWYSAQKDEWITDVIDTSAILEPVAVQLTAPEFTGYADLIQCIVIEKDYAGGSNLAGWNLFFRKRRLIGYSASTKFWNVNDADKVITYDTMNANMDEIQILRANINSAESGILSENQEFRALGVELVPNGLPNAGQLDYHRISLISADKNGDHAPDRAIFPELFSVSYSGPTTQYYETGNRINLGTYPLSSPMNRSFVNATTNNIQEILEEFEFRVNGQIFPHENVHVSTSPTGYWAIDPSQATSVNVTKILTKNSLGSSLIIPATSPVTNIVTGVAGTAKFTMGQTGTVNPINYLIPGAKITVTNTAPAATYVYNVTAVTVSTSNPDLAIVSVKEAILAGTVFNTAHNEFKFTFNRMVYFKRDDVVSEYYSVPDTATTKEAWLADISQNPERSRLYHRHVGRYDLNFAWFHRAARYNLVDPSATNIIDVFVITKGYYTALTRWLSGFSTVYPTPPTPLELRTSYAKFLENKMISDTVIMHPGKIKLLFGPNAIPELQATLKVIRPTQKTLTDNQFKVAVRDAVRKYFDIANWEFGETFYFSELSGFIHAALGTEIDSVVLVPKYSTNQFGDLYQVIPMEDEILYADINVSDIEVVTSYTQTNIRQ
jgi:hypothetical protein